MTQRRQWRWRGISRSVSPSFGPSVWVKAVCRRRGPMWKNLQGDDSVIAVRDLQRKSVDVPVIWVMKLDRKEREEDTTAESPPEGHGSC